jgi:hypothetical protein
LNRSAINVASRRMIANIASDDALILSHRANPAGLNFRERQDVKNRVRDLSLRENNLILPIFGYRFSIAHQ